MASDTHQEQSAAAFENLEESRARSDGTFDLSEGALLQGDHAAFEAMVRHETPRLYRIILRMVRDEDEAESLVQETFLQAYKGLDSFRGDSKFSTWLIGIGLNLARSSVRKRKRETVLSGEDLERLRPTFRMGRYVEKPRDWKPYRHLEEREKARVVREAMNRLPENYRAVITLRDLEELSTAETARALDLTEVNVRVRLHRAREALRAILEEHFEGKDLY